MAKSRCEGCGREFLYERHTNMRRRLCDSCRAERRRKRKQDCAKKESRALVDANDCAFDYPDADAIMAAKEKPRGVSDIRWRMELRRRANEEYFANCGDWP